jgi:hydrogenase nickel incorporation protein HypA/HybF
MHEFSIAESMMESITSAVGPTKKLSRVFVTIGPLAGIAPDILSFCFPEVCNLHNMGKPELVVTKVPVRLQCWACKAEYEAGDLFSGCPSCQSLERTILSGREFRIDSVEVEE